MDDRVFERIGAISAGAVGVLSVLYAVAYLGITPADQRGNDIDKFFRSYLAHPAGPRLAGVCLVISGLVSGAAVIALLGRLQGQGQGQGQGPGPGTAPGSDPAAGHQWRALTWAAVVAVVAGLATAAHGLSDLVGVDKLARRYVTGDAATRAAIAVAHVSPSQVDPRGLATFGAAGLVALVVGLAWRLQQPRLGWLGIALGIDMALLFVATVLSVNAVVLLTGGLASVVLGPLWWLAIARQLWLPRDESASPVLATPTLV